MAEHDDLPQVAELFLNVSGASWSRQVAELSHEHILTTGILRVAELGDDIVSVAGAVVRDHLWYLSSFWTRADLKEQGIGMPLLRHVWQAGEAAGATTFFTWSSLDTAAMAAYMKLGMFPGKQILHFAGKPQGLPAVPSAYRAVPLEPPRATDLDRRVRETPRHADHEFWSSRLGLVGRQILCDGEVVGYYYFNEHGAIGPMAWTEAADGQAILSLACQEVAEKEPEMSFAVPGYNHTALRFAFDVGLRLSRFNHYLTTSHFGSMERYLPSGPVLC